MYSIYILLIVLVETSGCLSPASLPLSKMMIDNSQPDHPFVSIPYITDTHAAVCCVRMTNIKYKQYRNM